MKSFKTYLMLFAGMALFGSATPLSKLVSKTFPVFIAGGMRVLLAFLVLLPFVRLSSLKHYRGRDLWLLIGIAFFGVFGFTVCMLYGMKLISGTTGSIVMSGTPALTAILSVIFFKEMLTWKKGIALMLAIAGVLVLQLHHSSDGQMDSWLGILLVFAAICCEAIYTLMGKALTKNYPPEEISCLSALLSFVCFIPFAFYQRSAVHFSMIQIHDYINLACYGLLTMGLGSVLWYKGIKEVEGTVAASFMGVMPVSALVLSYVLLQESFQWMQLVGFGLVFFGVLLMISVHRQMASASK